MCSYFLVLLRILAAAFCMSCNCLMVFLGEQNFIFLVLKSHRWNIRLKSFQNMLSRVLSVEFFERHLFLIYFFYSTFIKATVSFYIRLDIRQTNTGENHILP